MPQLHLLPQPCHAEPSSESPPARCPAPCRAPPPCRPSPAAREPPPPPPDGCPLCPPWRAASLPPQPRRTVRPRRPTQTLRLARLRRCSQRSTTIAWPTRRSTRSARTWRTTSRYIHNRSKHGAGLGKACSYFQGYICVFRGTYGHVADGHCCFYKTQTLKHVPPAAKTTKRGPKRRAAALLADARSDARTAALRAPRRRVKGGSCEL